MSRSNLSYQINSAINDAFKPGMDKYSAKKTGETDDKIYSYATKKNLQQVAFEFKDYMKENHNDIKLIKNVKPEHWQNFLIEKSKTCNNATLQNYVSRINKIEILTNKKFGFTSQWKDNISSPLSQKIGGSEKIRTQMMSKNDYNKISQSMKTSKSQAVPAIELARGFGLRVEEITRLRVEFVNLEKMELKVHGKGGKFRTLPILKENVGLLKDLTEGKKPSDKLINMKKDSINQFLNRTMKKLDLKDKYPKSGVHAIRKLRAQEVYDKARETMSKKESMDYVNKYLGHGKDRYDSFHVYVQNQH